MLLKISLKFTDYLITKGKVAENRRKIYDYGFELLFSTSSCVLSVLFLGLFFGYLAHTVVFLAYFIPIRIAGGGYHAESYAKCFLLTNTLAIGSIFTSKFIWNMDFVYVKGAIVVGFVWAIWYMWKVSPIIPVQYQCKTRYKERNRRYAHRILLLEILVLFAAYIANYTIYVYTAIVTSYLVALMMKIAKKGGKNDGCGINLCYGND